MIRRNLPVMLLATLLALAAPEGATAQEPVSSGGGSLGDAPMPRGNVRGGALAARAPGKRIKKGITHHVDRNKKAFFEFGGARISQTSEEANRGLKDEFLEVFLDSFLDALDEFVQAIELLLQTSVVQATPSQ